MDYPHPKPKDYFSMRKKTRIALMGAALAVVGGGLSIPTAASASAPPVATLPTMTPGMAASGGVLTVKGTGYPSRSADPTGLTILECSDPNGTPNNLPTDPSVGCDGTTQTTNNYTDSSGNLTAQFGVQPLSDQTSSNINCDATHYCVLWVGEDYNQSFADGTTEAFTAPFLVVPPTAPAFTSGTSASFPVFTTSSFTVHTSGINLPAIQNSSSLPPGVTFTDNGNGTATLAGKPTATGTYVLNLAATNGTTPNASQSFTLYAGFVVTTTSLPSASPGGSYSAQITATGGTTPYKYKVKGLPKGVKANKSTGAVTGTLLAKDKPGKYTVTVTVTDSKIKSSTKHPNPEGHGKETATKTLSLTVS